MSWTFIYLMVGLKIPIFALLYLVWWAIHQTPETEGLGDGGSARPLTVAARHRELHTKKLPA